MFQKFIHLTAIFEGDTPVHTFLGYRTYTVCRGEHEMQPVKHSTNRYKCYKTRERTRETELTELGFSLELGSKSHVLLESTDRR